MGIQLLLRALLLVSSLAGTRVEAMQASPLPFDVRQPDGTAISLRLHGNEHGHRLATLDGYHVIRVKTGETPSGGPVPANGGGQARGKPLWVFAKEESVAPGVEAYVPTQYAVGSVDPAAVGAAKSPETEPRGQGNANNNDNSNGLGLGVGNSNTSTNNGAQAGLPTANGAARNLARSATGEVSHEESLRRFRRVAPMGAVNNLVLMIQWADSPYTTAELPSLAQLDSLFNGPSQSVRDVWLTNSYGKLTITSVFSGWIKSSYTQATAAAGASGRVRIPLVAS